MAKAATKASVEAAHAGPDYNAALAIIEGRIANAKSAQSKASGEASQAWGSIEKMGIHKGGAQAAAKVLGMDDEDDQQDYLRSFSSILEAAGIRIKVDLMDMAEGIERPVVPKNSAAAPQADPPAAPSGDHDLADEPPPADAAAPAEQSEAGADIIEETLEPPIERPVRKSAAKPRLSIVAAKEAAQGHLEGQQKPVPDAMD